MMSRHRMRCMMGVLVVGLFINACGSNSSSVSVPATASTLYAHALAFKDSSLIAWGYNGFGQLGVSPSEVNRNYPKAVPGLIGMTGFSAGADHSLAFMNNSTVRAWGYNGYGQLGAAPTGGGGTPYSYTPVKAGSISGVIAVSAGGHHSLALKNDGTVWSWGYNVAGQLGDGSFTNKTDPVQVVDAAGSPLTGVAMIAAGGSHNLALKESEGTQILYAWGSNAYGQLGPDNPRAALPQSSKAVAVSGIEGTIVAIASGGSYNVALTQDGRVWAWGYNGLGELGTPPANLESFRETPKVVILDSGSDLTGVKEVVAGLDHVIVLLSDSTVRSWGFNRYGQLGNNMTADSYNPVQVVEINSDKTVAPLSGVQTIIPVKGNFTVVRKTDGSLWAWGDNTSGQLGDRTFINQWTPVRVADP